MRQMKRLVAAITLAVCTAAGQTSAQPQAVRPVFSTVPFWPPGGGPPAEFADSYFVYLDYSAQEYVISYPETLGTSLPKSSRRIEFRIEAQSAVDPDLSSTVVKNPDGTYSYRYVVRNGGTAKRPIREIGILTAVDDDSIILSHPSWSSSVPPAPGGDDGPLALRVRAGAARMVSWKTTPPDAISPGSGASGFQIQSRFLPGITTALASSGIVSAPPRQLPAQVQEQLSRVMAPEHNWNASIAIGPKFNPNGGPSKDPVWIANDFRLAVEKLRYNGRLASDSLFVQDLIAVLDVISQGGQRIPMQFKNAPLTPLENQIATAVQLSLSTK